MTNRTVLVTGASRGIGRACALMLAEAGARVAVAARTTDAIEQLAAEIRGQGHEAFPATLDMSSAESIKEAASKVAKEFGRIDILVNNAAITRDGLAMRMKRDDWDAVVSTNLTGPFLLAQQVLPGMVRERWGRR